MAMVDRRDISFMSATCAGHVSGTLKSEVCGEVSANSPLAPRQPSVNWPNWLDSPLITGFAVTHGPARQADIRQNYSAGKIRRTLAWEPEVDLKKGLQMTMNSFKNHVGGVFKMTADASRPSGKDLWLLTKLRR